MKIVTLNWGCGQTSIGKIISEIEFNTKLYDVEYLHIYESGENKAGNNVRLNGWFWTRVYYLISKILGIRYGIGYIPYLKVKYLIWRNRPDLVHIHCPNGHSVNLYKIFSYLKKKKIPIVITNHAEFFYTGSCSHSIDCMNYVNGCRNCEDYKNKEAGNKVCLARWAWKKMYHALDNPNITMVAVSPWVMEKMVKSPIALSADKLLSVIYNGVNTNIFRYLDQVHGQKNLKIFSASSGFTTDINSIKGGYYLNELAKRCIKLNVEFIVAGDAVYGEDISENIKFLGYIDNQEQLAEYYNRADATIIVSKRETFSMPVAESLCCGTPVIGFKNGGSESIALKEYCQFVDFGDIDALYNIIKEQKFVQFKRQLIEEQAHRTYSSARMAEQYYKLYLTMIQKAK